MEHSIDKEKVIKGLKCHTKVNCVGCPYEDGWRTGACPFGETLLADAISLLKEQDKEVKSWIKQIADNQLANAPADWQNENQKLYSKGIWDGLQIAIDILSEGK